MHMQYENYSIRHATSKDVDQLVTWWNDGEVMAHAGFPQGIHTHHETVERQINDPTSPCQRLILEYDKKMIGEMSYYPLKDHQVEIGIKICHRNDQNQGHGRIFLSMLIEMLFIKGYQQIVLDTMLENMRAQHVYESLGFERKGMRVDCWKDQEGKMRTAVDYALTKERFICYLDKEKLLLLSIEEKDADIIYEEAKQHVFEYEDISIINIDHVLEWMKRKYRNHQNWFYKIIKNSQVVGYFGIRDTEDGYEIEDIYLFKEYRGQGIGKQLLQYIIDTYPGMLELCVFRKNKRAISLYQTFGFYVYAEKSTRLFMKRGS